MSRKLYRSTSNKVIAGICGGLGEHFDIDPTIIRIVAVVAGLASCGAVLLFYLLAWIIIPQQPFGETPAESVPTVEPSVRPLRAGWRVYLPGLILVSIGGLLLLREYVVWFQWHDIWPLILVVLGLLLIFRDGNRANSGRRRTGSQADGEDTLGKSGGIHS